MDVDPDHDRTVIKRLAAERDAFLGFLEKRLPSREDAEDVLQQAFVRGIERAETVADTERSVAWFYSILRRAVIDWYRARAAAPARTSFDESCFPDDFERDAELKAALCRCVLGLAQALPKDYAEVLSAVDIDGGLVVDYAKSRGISAANARVRLFRARESLRAKTMLACRACAAHGCLDCTCRD